MDNDRRFPWWFCLIGSVLAVLFAFLGSGGDVEALDYSIIWWTIDTGGYQWSSGNNYTIGGTVGQPDAGTSIGAHYDLYAGYWQPCRQPGEISSTTITWISPTLSISWTGGEATIYRDLSDPFFGPDSPYLETSISPWTDPDPTGADTERNAFYILESSDCAGSKYSDRMGAISFNVVGGPGGGGLPFP